MKENPSLVRKMVSYYSSRFSTTPMKTGLSLWPLPNVNKSEILLNLVGWINTQIQQDFRGRDIFESKNLDNDVFLKQSLDPDDVSWYPTQTLIEKFMEFLHDYAENILVRKRVNYTTSIGYSDEGALYHFKDKLAGRSLWVKPMGSPYGTGVYIAATLGFPTLYTLLSRGYERRGFTADYFDQPEELFDIPGLVWAKAVEHHLEDVKGVKLLIIAEKIGDFETILDTQGIAWNVTFDTRVPFDDIAKTWRELK